MAAKNLSMSGFLFDERRDFYVRPQVTKELFPSITPFVTTLMDKPAMPTKDPDFKLFEHRSGFIQQEFSANDAAVAWASAGAVSDTATIAGIDGIKGLATTAGDPYKGLEVEIWDAAKEVYKGNALVINSNGTNLTIKSLGNPRAISNQASALADNDVFIVTTAAFGEGTDAPEAYSDELEGVYNSAQILKVPVEITGTLYEAALRGYSNELARLRVEQSKVFKLWLNQMYLFGVRPKGIGSIDLNGDSNSDSFATHVTDANGKTVRMSMGMVPALYKYGTKTGDKQNIFDVVAATYDWNKLVEDSGKIFQYIPSSGMKKAVCGMGALNFWSKLAGGDGFVKNTKFNITLSDWKVNELRMNVKILETPGGIIELAYDPAFRGQYKNHMLIYDNDNVDRYVYRNQRYQANIKTDNAYDGVKDQFFADEGLGINLIETHSLWIIK